MFSNFKKGAEQMTWYGRQTRGTSSDFRSCSTLKKVEGDKVELSINDVYLPKEWLKVKNKVNQLEV